MAAESSILPHVTIVIPVYNLDQYVANAVTSAQRQSYCGPMHIVICDDGSTDQSLKVVQEIADNANNIRVYHHENRGRAHTRNRLLELADTELVAWLDGDDLASPQWIESQVAFLQANDNCVAVSAHGYAMTADSLAIAPIMHPLEGDEIDRLHISGQASAFFQSCVVVRKSAVLQAGGYDFRYKCAEDYSLWLRMSEIGQLANVDEFHLFYRVHSTSANWTVNVEQRTQGHSIMNEARVRRGLPTLAQPASDIPAARKDDWNRRIYWINAALKSGNPYSALQMLLTALALHPGSLLLWLMAIVSVGDTVLFFGNRVAVFVPGKPLSKTGETLPLISFYRFFRAANRLRRGLHRKC